MYYVYHIILHRGKYIINMNINNKCIIGPNYHPTILYSSIEVTIRPAAERILTKPGMMTFLVCFMRRLIRVICLLTRVS